ncbi:MAG: GNAT family N-acetyltransferase [Candidatus Jordarchaeaceae archaeon]
MIKVDLLTKNDEMEYENFLSKCEFSLIQHGLDWRNVIHDLEKDEAFFIVAKENNEIIGALPMYYYKCKFGNLLTTIAWYTISGIISSNKTNPRNIYKALLEYSLILGKELDCTVVSIGTNPFLDDKEYYLNYFEPDYTMENFIQYINLNEIFDKAGNLIHPNYTRRSDITRNLKKAKLQQTLISDEQTPKNVDEWFKIHVKRMKEINATPIPKKLFDGILKHLVPKEEGKFLFAFYEGKMIFGSSYTFNKKILDVFMMSMDSKYGEIGAGYLTTYQMLELAHKKGISIFNWMSSDRRGSGVYKWKEKWGSRERTFLYLTKILGDISQWKNMEYHELKEAYDFHYLLPFNLLKDTRSKFTTKDELASFMQSWPEVKL